MNKYTLTPEQYKKMCGLLNAAMKNSPAYSPYNHTNVLADVRKILSGLQKSKAFAPGSYAEMQVGQASVVERYEIDVVQYNMLHKYIGWAKAKANKTLGANLNEFQKLLNMARFEYIGNKYTEIVIAGACAHLK